MTPPKEEQLRANPGGPPLFELLLVRSESHAAGGGRTKFAVAGRKILGAEASTLAIGAVTITGAVETCAVFSLALGVEQIEQAWRVAFG